MSRKLARFSLFSTVRGFPEMRLNMSSEKQAPRGTARRKTQARAGGDPLLGDYLAALGKIPLLTAEEELDLARRLRDAEELCWRLLLSLPETVDHLLEAHAFKHQPEIVRGLEGLQKRVARGGDAHSGSARRQKAFADAIGAVAERLRHLDDDRRLFEDGLVAIRPIAITPRPGEKNAERRKRTMAQRKKRARLFEEIDRERSRALRIRDRFVSSNLRLVVSVARKFHHHRLPLIDLIQEGNLGLIKSVHRFDHHKGFRFSTYAHWWIRQSIERAIMNKGAQVRLPVHVFDSRREIAKMTHEFRQHYGRDPSKPELAKALLMPEKKLEELLRAVPREPLSLHDPVGDDEDRNLGEVLFDAAEPVPDDQVISVETRRQIRGILNLLSPMERDIIERRFGFYTESDETLEEIGRSYNLSRERVRQIQVQGLQKMRRICERRRVS
jgi:RNA polymerase primary sigma factor